MYIEYFGLTDRPFNLTANADVVYFNASYRAVYEEILAAIRSDKEIITLTGESGSGKTLLQLKLLEDLRESFRCVHVSYTRLSFSELISYICADLGIEATEKTPGSEIQLLQDFLRSSIRSISGNVVIVVDEAQVLSAEMYGQLLELMALCNRDATCMQLVLSFQTLEECDVLKVALTEYPATPSLHCQLHRLDNGDIAPYITYRLEKSGDEKGELFTDEALELIGEKTGGLQRAVNLLCEKALQFACSSDKKLIDADIVESVLSELDLNGTFEEEGGSGFAATPSTHSAEEDRIDDYVAPELRSATEAMSAQAEQPGQYMSLKQHRELQLQDDLKGEIIFARPKKPKYYQGFLFFASILGVAAIGWLALDRVNHQQAVISDLRSELRQLRESLSTERPKSDIAELAEISESLSDGMSDSLPAVATLSEASRDMVQSIDEPVAFGVADNETPEQLAVIDKATFNRWIQEAEEEIPTANDALPHDMTLPNSTTDPVPELSTSQLQNALESTEAISTEDDPLYPISELLKKAKALEATNRLTVPAGNSALDVYREILKLDAENTVAKAGIKGLEQTFIAMAERDLNQGQLESARNNYRKVLKIAPSQESARVALKEITFKLLQPKASSSTRVEMTLIDDARSGDIETVRRKLQEGISTDTRAGDGTTALMVAADNGHLGIVQLLIDVGANIDRRNSQGDSALLLAVWSDHTELVELLLKHKASINVKNKGGWTPVIGAAINGNDKILRTLFENGADINAKNQEGKTGLAAAAWNGRERVVRLFVLAGADVDTADNDGWTPLMHASWSGHTSIVDFLLKHGAKKEIRNRQGETALSLSSRQNRAEIVKLLSM